MRSTVVRSVSSRNERLVDREPVVAELRVRLETGQQQGRDHRLPKRVVVLAQEPEGRLVGVGRSVPTLHECSHPLQRGILIFLRDEAQDDLLHGIVQPAAGVELHGEHAALVEHGVALYELRDARRAE
jgi:hypothetical protein